jgi:TonB family protein
MQLYDVFCNKGNTKRGTYFALSISLAFHMVIFLVLVTASAAPAILMTEDDQIIHVSLTSMVAIQNSYTRDLREPRENKDSTHREIVETVKLVTPIEKQDRVNVAVEPASHRVVEVPRPKGSEMMYATSTQPLHKAQDVSSFSGRSSFGEISLAVPRYRENTPPAYPTIARMRGYEGIVLLAAEIFADGRVGSLKIKQSSGYGVLDRSAVKAVQTWKFEPGRRLGKPVSVWVDVPVKFILKDTETI